MPRPQRFTWFAVVLYPQEDAFHKHVLDYIQANTNLYPISAAVEHCRDFDSDDDDTVGYLDSLEQPCGTQLIDATLYRKPHVHLLFKCGKQMTINSILKRFDLSDIVGRGQRLNYIEGISDPVAYCQYMAHMDFRSLHNRCKSRYTIDEFVGNREFIESCLVLEPSLNNWQLLVDGYSVVKRIGFEQFARDIISEGNETRARQLWAVFSKCQGLFLSAENSHKYDEMRVR